MRKLIITAATVAADPKETKGGKLYAPLAVNRWTRKGMMTTWITAFFPSTAKVKKGDAVQVTGTFDVAISDKGYLNVNLNVDSMEYARGSQGGLFLATVSNVGVITPLQETNGAHYLRVVYTVYNKGGEEKRWASLFCHGDMLERVKALKIDKGSSIDIVAVPNFSVSQYNGENQLNITFSAVSIEYANHRKKSDDGQEPQKEYTYDAPAAPAAAPAAPTAPAAPAPTTARPLPDAPADGFTETTEAESFYGDEEFF